MIFGFKKKVWPTLSIEEIRKRSKIVVIDDMEFFYHSLFVKDGYNIDKWDDINDMQKLEAGYYDIILLDIQDVGKTYTKDQGFGILKHLKKRSPTQLIIAYSNADFSLKYQDFFRIADAALAKTDDYIHFKRTVDELLEKRFSIDYYVEKIVELANSGTIDLNKLRRLTVKSIEKRKASYIAEFINEYIDNENKRSMILQVIHIAISIASL